VLRFSGKNTFLGSKTFVLIIFLIKKILGTTKFGGKNIVGGIALNFTPWLRAY